MSEKLFNRKKSTSKPCSSLTNNQSIYETIDLSSDEESQQWSQSITDDKLLIINEIVNQYINNNGLNKLDDKTSYVDSFFDIMTQIIDKKQYVSNFEEIQDIIHNTINSINETESVEMIKEYHIGMTGKLFSKLSDVKDSDSEQSSSHSLALNKSDTKFNQNSIKDVSDNSLRTDNINNSQNKSSILTKTEDKESHNNVEQQLVSLEIKFLHLKKLVKKLGTKEVPLNSLKNSDSIYVIKGNIEKELVETYKKMCRLSNKSLDTGKEIDKSFNFSFIDNFYIREKIESEMSRLMKRREFPDAISVKKIVESVINEKKVGLKNTEKYARNIFLKIGKEIKKRRKIDTEDFFDTLMTNKNTKSLPLPDFDDKDLENKLQRNSEISKEKLKKLLENNAEDDEMSCEETFYEQCFKRIDEEFQNMSDLSSTKKRSNDSKPPTPQVLKRIKPIAVNSEESEETDTQEIITID